MEPVLRHAEARDAGTVLDLVRRLAEIQGAGDQVTATPDDLLRDGFGAEPAFRAIIAEEPGGTAVGLALYYFTYSTWSGAPNLYVEDLYVDPELRGGGLGGRLMAELARVALTRGCQRLELAVKTDNVARGFYERLGLSRKGSWLPYAVSDAALARLAERTTA